MNFGMIMLNQSTMTKQKYVTWILIVPQLKVAPDLLKALAILSDTNVRRSAVDREDLKPY